MEFKICVIATFCKPIPKSNYHRKYVRSKVFACLNEALDFIRSFDEPPIKVSLHILSH